MRGGDPTKYHAMRDFGAIGNSISYAIGVAAARKTGKVVLFEGDGSLLMHIQELEAVKRHGLKLLFVVANDGALRDRLVLQQAVLNFRRRHKNTASKMLRLDGSYFDGHPSAEMWITKPLRSSFPKSS